MLGHVMEAYWELQNVKFSSHRSVLKSERVSEIQSQRYKMEHQCHYEVR